MIKPISSVEFRFYGQIIRFGVDLPFYPDPINIAKVVDNDLSDIKRYLNAKNTIRYVRFLGQTDFKVSEFKFTANFSIDFRNGMETNPHWLVKDDDRLQGDDLVFFQCWMRNVEVEMIGTARYILNDLNIKIISHLSDVSKRLQKAAENVEKLLEV